MFKRRPKAILILKDGKDPGTLDIDLKVTPKRGEGEPPHSHKTALVLLSVLFQTLNVESEED